MEVIPDIAAAETEYRDANEACLNNDPNLERDLFSADTEQVRRRIHRAASLREDAMMKKEVYLTAEIQRLRNLRSRLVEGDLGNIPTGWERKSLQIEQALTLQEQGRVEGELRDLPGDDEYAPKRRVFDQERIHLIDIQNTIAERLQALDSIERAQRSLHSAAGVDVLAQELDETVKIWEQERDGAKRQRAHWGQLYVAMEQALSKKAPDPAAPRKGSPKKPPGHAAPSAGPPA